MEKPTEKEVPLFVIVIFPTGITYDVNSDKPECAN